MGVREESRAGGGPKKPRKNHLISRRKFREYVESHPESAKDKPVFNWWCKKVEKSSWTKFSDVKDTFGTADKAKGTPYVVFDVCGNKYRVVAEIDYKSSLVFVAHILTHKEYDKEQWKEV